MIIKKYQAPTENDAIILAKEELGKDAIVMNIKKISPRGFYKMFKKSVVEITAAVDDAKPYTVEPKKENVKKVNSVEKTSAIEEKLNSLQVLIEKQINENDTKAKKEIEKKLEEKVIKEVSKERTEIKKEDIEKKPDEKDKDRTEKCIELVKKQLLKHEVDEKYIDMIIREVTKSVKKDTPVDNILTSIYQKIVLKLGQPSLIEPGEDRAKYIFFMGPTGVGKTTTIAKIASDFKINKKLNIALLTSDTYRIAAVEQLRIYANILKVPLNVVYSAEEIIKLKEELDKYDVVLIDTAGRSHKNNEQKQDLCKLIEAIEPKDRSVYLVLSATTKYSDLVNIVEAYSDINDYRLLFTKLDETTCVGNILNIKLLTNAPLSYTAFGQDVPKDIEKLDAQSIARQLLGGEQ